jgi:hypothetical protein
LYVMYLVFFLDRTIHVFKFNIRYLFTVKRYWNLAKKFITFVMKDIAKRAHFQNIATTRERKNSR